MITTVQEQALQQIAEAAVATERATACPAELSAAQAVLESSWLRRSPGKNCFGIKPDHHGAGVQYFESREYLNGEWEDKQEAFEKYDSLADCFADHARLIQSGVYSDAWRQYEGTHNLDELIEGIATHYATDPGYAAKVEQLAHGPHLTAAIAAARTAEVRPVDLGEIHG